MKTVEFNDVRGRPAEKRALLIAAAGGCNTLFVGPPAAGRSILCRATLDLLPPTPTQRPFRAPHHSISPLGLRGTDKGQGEMALAHEGILYLREIGEFKYQTLNAIKDTVLRKKVEARDGRWSVPADFLLLADGVGYDWMRTKAMSTWHHIFDIHCKPETQSFLEHRAAPPGPPLAELQEQVRLARSLLPARTPDWTVVQWLARVIAALDGRTRTGNADLQEAETLRARPEWIVKEGE